MWLLDSRAVRAFGDTTMRTDFLKRRDEDSYSVVEVLVDIKAYIADQITSGKKDDGELKKAAEDIIVQAFKKQKFIKSQPYLSVKEGEDGKNRVLEKISSVIGILVEVEEQVGALKLDGSIHEEKILKSLVSNRLRKIKEEIETLEMQTRAIVQDSVSA